MSQPASISALVLFCTILACSGQNCPPEDLLRPHCWCLNSEYGGALFCQDIFNPVELVPPLEACQDRKVTALGIFNSSLQYIPHYAFKGTKFAKITFINTQLMSLSNAPLAFEGLENSLQELRAIQTQYSTLWRFRQLRELKEMTLIDINNILMESLSERLPTFPKLDAFGLVRAGITYLDEEVFADCHALKILDLRHNHIRELHRSMLPNPASRLTILNFQDNHLESLPNDFFEGMPVLLEVLLSENRISTLDEKTYGSVFAKVNTFDLSDNPLRCDCRLLWLVNKRFPHWLHARCQEPESLRGYKLQDLQINNLWC